MIRRIQLTWYYSVRAALPCLFMITPAYSQQLFYDDLDGHEARACSIVGGFSGIVTTESVQGYAGIGELGNTFSGNFVRNTSAGNPAPPTILTLNNLPSHSDITISFLLAVIDSWDGSSFPPAPSQAPDFFNVRVDGAIAFSETFTNLIFAGGTQSYSGPALVREVQLGFEQGSSRLDSAYEITLTVPHSSNTLVVDLFASGAGWQQAGSVGPEDESWGIDNLKVDSGTIVNSGDIDGDSNIDLTDFMLFADCLNGPDIAATQDCKCADLDQDTDVDLLDFALFQPALGG